MDVVLSMEPYAATLYGLYAPFEVDYGYTGTKIMQHLFPLLEEYGLQPSGSLHWIYLPRHIQFVGVPLDVAPPERSGLETHHLQMDHHASYRHVGPYQQLLDVNAAMREEIIRRGLSYAHPCVEVYGEFVNDESALVTMVYWSVHATV